MTCWPISIAFGSDLLKKIKLFCVFKAGMSAILVTVDNEVFAVGANPSGALGTGTDEPCTKPTKIKGVTAGW